MSDDRKFQPVIGQFEDAYRHYHGGELVAAVLWLVTGFDRAVRNGLSSYRARTFNHVAQHPQGAVGAEEGRLTY
jgi:hypothetical protein